MSSDPLRQAARELARTHLEKGDPTGWFEPLYQNAKAGTATVPWADLQPNPSLMEWAVREELDGAGRTAVKIGCGLGDDAEELSRLGFHVTAFDISPTAIAWCKERFPQSRVRYVVADLLNLPAAWRWTFDFVLESYTLQVLPPQLRPAAIEACAALVAPQGRLLAICRGREESEDPGKMPWPLLRSELSFEQFGLKTLSFEDFKDHESPPVRRFRALYSR